MTRPTVVVLCEHGETKLHKFVGRIEQPPHSIVGFSCPGGRVLEEAIIIQRDTDGWQLPPQGWLVLNAATAFGVPGGPISLLDDLADALASAQENQP